MDVLVTNPLKTKQNIETEILDEYLWTPASLPYAVLYYGTITFISGCRNIFYSVKAKHCHSTTAVFL